MARLRSKKGAYNTAVFSFLFSFLFIFFSFSLTLSFFNISATVVARTRNLTGFVCVSEKILWQKKFPSPLGFPQREGSTYFPPPEWSQDRPIRFLPNLVSTQPQDRQRTFLRKISIFAKNEEVLGGQIWEILQKNSKFEFFIFVHNIFPPVFLITKIKFLWLWPYFQGQIVSFQKFGFSLYLANCWTYSDQL